MQKVETVKLSQISCKNIPVNNKSLSFALDMLLNNIFPPVRVERLPTGRYMLRDGRHRFAAHKLLGREDIRVKVRG